MRETVVVLDFGSQYTQLIARRIREHKVYCEIHPCATPVERLRAMAPRALVLSGGPASCYQPGAPGLSPEVFDLGVPVLGICYGLQLAARLLGGRVVPGETREFGRAHLRVIDPAGDLLHGFAAGERVPVWMSHGDRIEALPAGFRAVGETEDCPFAAVEAPARRFVGVQFHPEVAHTPRGSEMLANFLFRAARLAPTWTMASFLEEACARVRDTVGASGRVLCALSGGVDSSVVAALLYRAVGDRVHCIFVDHGLGRSGEPAEVERTFGEHLGVPLRVVDASERFLSALAGVADPEDKRKLIGREFIAVFEAEARALGGFGFLAQGTLYPDVIESVSQRGPSATIKSHHNVGGLPERMGLRLIEPLRELFKDEVRNLGEDLGLPERVIRRQPFPGPGLAVRVVGEVTRERLELLRAADAIVEEEVRAAGLYESLWQSFAVLLPVRSVGVMGDARTYEQACAIRAVHSVDGMTADWARLPPDLLAAIANRIINEVRGINRVLYDISSKPPATIEWE